MRMLEDLLFRRGYVRSPNCHTLWYASGPNIIEPIHGDLHIVYIPEHAPEGRIIIVPKYTDAVYPFTNAIAIFRDTADLNTWLIENGQLSQSGLPSFYNSWD